MPADAFECPVCAKIPRIVGDDENVWRAALPLVPPVPHDDGHVLTHCETCDALYRYARTTERDLTWESVSTSLTRLNDVERLGVLPPAERASFASRLPERAARWRGALDHPAEWLRRDAAWNLTAIARRDGRWDEHVQLLGHPDADVRNEVAKELEYDPTVAEAPESLAAALAQVRGDPREATRAAAARALTVWRLARGEERMVIDEVLRDPDGTRIAAVLHAVGRALTPALALDAVRTLALLYREKPVREAVASLLDDCVRQGASETIVPPLLDFLRDDDVETAEAALRILRSVPVPCHEVVPVLPRWCTNPATQFRAYLVLQEQARLGADLAPLLPLLGDRLEAVARSEPAETVKVLLAMLPHASDPLPVVRELLRGVPGRWETTILGSIDRVARSGADLRSLEPRVRSLLDGAEAANDAFTAGWLRQVLASIQAR